MILFSEMFVSELVGVNVVDRLQEPVGRIKDLLLTVGDTFPRVSALLIRLDEKKEEAVLLMTEIDLIGRHLAVTKSSKDRLVYSALRTTDLLLWRDLMDKQIVDTQGARVIRVNDLQLALVNQDVRLIAADVGLRGMLRRLGLLSALDFLTALFGKRTTETLIGWDHVEHLKTGRARGMITVPTKHVSELHPSDIAGIISQVHTEEKTAIFNSLTDKVASEALHELEPKIQAYLLTTVDTKKALGILEKMPSDEAADVLGDLPEERVEEFLRLLRPRKAEKIRKLLSHPEETAGGLMTTEYITVPDDYTVQHTIERMRETAPDAETIYYLFVVDPSEKLVGVLSLRSLLVSPPDKKISEIMIKETISVDPAMNQRKVAELISKYNLLAVPVIDPEGKILGIVTVDDVVDFVLPPLSRRKKQMVG